jgi:tetratricopeptide (TPR) repeat protein
VRYCFAPVGEERVSQTQQFSLDEALRQAVTLHQAGRAQEAEPWYRAILEAAPKHGDANHNFGLLLQQYGPTGAGLPYLETAYVVAPNHPQFVLSYAAALQEKESIQSRQILEGAIARGVSSAEICCNLANLLRAEGRHLEAKDALRAALRLRPNYAIAYYNLGLIEQDEGLFASAATNYRHAIAHQTDFAQAYNNLGLALSSNNEPHAAVAQFANALIIDPQYAQAAFNRGQACCKLGLLHQAQANFLWAASVTPDFTAARNELGLVLLSHGDAAGAASHFRATLAVEPDSIAARVNLVNALMSLQRWDEAQTQVRQTIELYPDCSAAYHNLGTIWRQFNDFNNAEIAYRRAIAIDSGFAEATLGLAAVIRYHDMDETMRLCHRALALKSDFAIARVLLAECLVSHGLFADAEAQLRRAIVLEPTLAEAWAAMSTLRKMTRADVRWLACVSILADSELSPEKEAFLRYALGKAYDDLGEYAEAFRQFRVANEATKQFALPYNRELEERRTDWICADYKRDWVCARRTAITSANASHRPVFVLGMPRSGTSLVEQILAAHPSVAGAGELSYWRNAAAQFSPFTQHGIERCLPTEAELIALAGDYLAQLSHFDAKALRVVDKMPANFQCLGLIHAALPDARIIHVQRNPIDTCLSIYFQHFESYHSYANDLENLAHFYRLYRRLMSHWTSILPSEAILHLSYEALVQDQEVSTRKLLDFIELPWDASCLQFQEVERRVGTASNWQVRQPINRRSVERWRHYASELGPLKALEQIPGEAGSDASRYC